MEFQNKSQVSSTITVSVDENLHLQTENGQVVVSSRVVSDRFGKLHKHVLDSIENILESGVAENWADLFVESQYQHEQNKQYYREYLLTRDGFTLLAMGFTGKEALQWKLKYIEAFNRMEQQLKQNNPLEGISSELQAIIMQDKKLQQIEHKVTELEDNIHITRSQQKQLKKFVNEVIVKALGGKCTPAYKELSHKAYSEFWNAYYNALNVASYLDTPKKDFHLALKFVNEWVPSRDLALMIRGANSMEVAE
ncbi:Rha family transcriptional regulator [Niameybacter massiliensis]|uniref:Rha family transcriptional regulator n=1 Tax=Niameybacter massiliensis TaxID=1658108 RepID=UPI0006B64F9C|nr:Rha family transcriptional regulator [Niameybacter massiliensis]